HEFLGFPALAAFQAPLDYLRRWRDSGRLFHHAHPLVGRADVVRTLHEFVQSSQHRVAVLVGRGGIGKTRLLCEFADQFEEQYAADRVIRFLVDGVPLDPTGLDELPVRPCLVVVDDAHRRDDLGLLLEWVQQHPNSRILLTTRPQAVDLLHSNLWRVGYDPQQVVDLAPLGSLSFEDTVTLSREVLGPDFAGVAERLARATRDCPLVTTIGGRLVRDGVVGPDLLERNEDFQRVALDRFREELLGRVSDRIAPELCRRLLQVFAALAPVPAESEQFHRAVAAYLRIDAAEVARTIGELEATGLLLRRGRYLRIIPDVLADHILHSACLTSQGVPTGFAYEAFRTFAATFPERVLRNLAELDWRVRATDAV
ncbi:MAG: hypothetical protein J2P46_15490, partial [Zavarzinella sp.]|nr:hypothetical protein [Zavarzinella sp.]